MQSYRNIHSVSHRDDPEALLERLSLLDSLVFLKDEKAQQARPLITGLADEYKLYSDIYNSKTVTSRRLEAQVCCVQVWGGGGGRQWSEGEACPPLCISLRTSRGQTGVGA